MRNDEIVFEEFLRKRLLGWMRHCLTGFMAFLDNGIFGMIVAKFV